jgi:excisionase family DNA binding protein
MAEITLSGAAIMTLVSLPISSLLIIAGLLTTQEVAKRLGVLPRQVTRLIEKGKIPAQKYGRDYLIDEKDLEEYSSNRRQPGRPRKKND